MSISRQNLTVIIVSFKSENVIHDCIQSIDKDLQILIIDNSNNKKFKQDLEKKYKNVMCILSEKNLGMGSGNNLGIKNTKTDFVFILNPDVILENNTIDELINASNKIDTFGIIAPIVNSNKNLNYKLFDKNKINTDNSEPFLVKSVDGFAMLLNTKKINQIENFKNFNFFDENIFLYLENDDLCKRLTDMNVNIYVVPKSKINHLGGKAVDKNFSYTIELSRNWHWIWSKFYYQKKHNGYFKALINGFPSFLSAILKYIFYLIILNSKKRSVYLHRAMGYLNAALGRKSFYRPNIKI